MTLPSRSALGSLIGQTNGFGYHVGSVAGRFGLLAQRSTRTPVRVLHNGHTANGRANGVRPGPSNPFDAPSPDAYVVLRH